MESIFSIRLKDLRIERGLSQAALAEALHYTQSNICEWEKGSVEPRLSAIFAVSTFFGVGSDFLLGLTDETGVPGSMRSTALAPDEEEIVMLFRAMSKTQRTRLIAFGEGLLSGSDIWQKPLNRKNKP